MILVASQRGGGGQLAAHLMNDRDNDHVTLAEVRGFVAGDLHGAFGEAHAISKGTRCKQYLFSLSLSPPKDAAAGIDVLIDAADRAETTLGLTGQPRAIVIHEKNGRRHAHVVWSRIDAAEMKAVNLPHFKNRLSALSRELYLEHGWELPEGHRTNGWKNPLNFTLGEWQQAQRLGLDPRKIKLLFREAWQRSDNLASFRHALEERGYFLAQGDRRGFVALDIEGEPFSVARWTGLKTKDVKAKLGEPDGLPSVDEVRRRTRQDMSDRLRGFIREDRRLQREALEPLLDERQAMVAAQRAERDRLARKQDERRTVETKERAERFAKGLRGVWNRLTGKTAAVRQQNEREAYEAHLRDRDQREALFAAQNEDRRTLQLRIDALQARHRAERMKMARHIVPILRRNAADRQREQPDRPRRHRSPDLEIER